MVTSKASQFHSLQGRKWLKEETTCALQQTDNDPIAWVQGDRSRFLSLLDGTTLESVWGGVVNTFRSIGLIVQTWEDAWTSPAGPLLIIRKAHHKLDAASTNKSQILHPAKERTFYSNIRHPCWGQCLQSLCFLKCLKVLNLWEESENIRTRNVIWQQGGSQRQRWERTRFHGLANFWNLIDEVVVIPY